MKKPIWKGSRKPILRGQQRSPWLLTTYKSWDDPPGRKSSRSSKPRSHQILLQVLCKLRFFRDIDRTSSIAEAYPARRKLGHPCRCPTSIFTCHTNTSPPSCDDLILTMIVCIYTLSKTDIAPENRPKPKKIVSSFNDLIFRCELAVSFREG